jgi:hypothetical protein
LYGDPYRVPEYVDAARGMMRAHGYLKPIVAGEHGGPAVFEFPLLDAVLQETLASAFAEPPATQSTGELQERPAGASDPYQMMHLVSGKLMLLDYEDGVLGRRYPAADTFQLLAAALAGVVEVTRIGSAVYAYRVERAGRGPLLVVWDRRDTFDGEDEPPVPVSLPWPAPAATAVDAFGGRHAVEVGARRVRLLVSDTPVLIAGD